jgi:acetyl esterase
MALGRATFSEMSIGFDALLERVLARLATCTISATAHSAAFAGRIHERATGSLRDLSIEHDMAYGPLPAQRLDVYRLRDAAEARPMLLYLHGGGFQLLSRRTHARFATLFAKAGYVVFNADYRLAPRHPYPAATDDARRAAEFVLAQATRWGGKPGDLTVAGDSAGANLALGLAFSGKSIPLQAAVLFSGFLQVSHPARLERERALSRVVRARIASIPRDYLGGRAFDREPHHADPLLDPLLWLEQEPARVRDLPLIYASVGTADPVVSDTLRLKQLLAAADVPHRVDVYADEPHVFQGMPLRQHARASWHSCLTLLAESRRQKLEASQPSS